MKSSIIQKEYYRIGNDVKGVKSVKNQLSCSFFQNYSILLWRGKLYKIGTHDACKNIGMTRVEIGNARLKREWEKIS